MVDGPMPLSSVSAPSLQDDYFTFSFLEFQCASFFSESRSNQTRCPHTFPTYVHLDLYIPPSLLMLRINCFLSKGSSLHLSTESPILLPA